jgi:hypothetical protein
MKIKKQRKKQKGIRYIAKVLQKYGGKKYKKYSAALEKSRSVLSQIKDQGEKVKVVTVLDKVRKHRAETVRKKVKPELFYRLRSPEPYYTLIDYPTYINDTTNEITFISEISNEGISEIKAGTKPEYKDTFSSFVNFGNKQMSSMRISSSDEITIFVMATEPEKIDGKWISRIISVDESGEEYDFGFSPQPESTLPKEVIEPAKKKKGEKPTQKLEKSDQEKIRELDLKILKEKSRQQANEMFLKGLYNKKEYKDEIDRINKL